MPDPASHQTPPTAPVSIGAEQDYPLREYIGSMAGQLALMARAEGDEGLAALLEAVVDRAARVAPGSGRCAG